MAPSLSTPSHVPSWPITAKWCDTPLESYCLVEIKDTVIRMAKTSQNEGRCLNTGRSIEFTTPETKIVILDFPQPHVCIHEAGHLVFALEQIETAYVSEGIMFNPYSPDGGECGRWLHPDPVAGVRLALIGVLAQAKMAPSSIDKGLLKLFQTSVILDPSEKRPSDVAEERWACLAGAKQDIENARNAARRIKGNESEQAIIELLKEQERYLKTILTKSEFCTKVQLVANDIPNWFKSNGRTRWEEAIAYPNAILYPRPRAAQVLADAGF